LQEIQPLHCFVLPTIVVSARAMRKLLQLKDAKSPMPKPASRCQSQGKKASEAPALRQIASVGERSRFDASP